eukprot:TRINITY_DN8886_c0_g1_i3.p1 TRINITY_DN8886_c0_g1~~TRINITY_DN8886_c0_g1_i3.p1  ORF type:complete len:134 (-),score=1.89 TRINITY_DN8886_c0_g1_i3:480-881(-)
MGESSWQEHGPRIILLDINKIHYHEGMNYAQQRIFKHEVRTRQVLEAGPQDSPFLRVWTKDGKYYALDNLDNWGLYWLKKECGVVGQIKVEVIPVRLQHHVDSPDSLEPIPTWYVVSIGLVLLIVLPVIRHQL